MKVMERCKCRVWVILRIFDDESSSVTLHKLAMNTRWLYCNLFVSISETVLSQWCLEYGLRQTSNFLKKNPQNIPINLKGPKVKYNLHYG